MVSNAIERHCRELDRCNQRGGRMLSVADLIAADTMPLSLAAALAARINEGASFMVGANPGGAGKTTVMCALLNFLPAAVDIQPATPEAVRHATTAPPQQRCCYLCHEIGDGPYYAYLWGEALRQYCSLGEQGHILATNLHADTPGEAEAQVCDENHVPREHFRRFALLVFLRVNSAARTVSRVYVSNNGAAHSCAYDAETGMFTPEAFAPPAQQQACRRLLERFLQQPDRTIHAMRRAVLQEQQDTDATSGPGTG